jgi:hypothetical protein
MKVQVSLKRGRKLIAHEIVSQPRLGDLTTVVGRLLADARKLQDGLVGDFQIVFQQISQASSRATTLKSRHRS